ncbi:MAG: hypothetical protein EZS28_002668, partial [Streblomastix strix]
MHIQIQQLSGKKFSIEISSSEEKIKTVKLRILGITSIVPKKQFLVYKSDVLEDERTLGSYGIREGSTIDLVEKQDPENNQNQEKSQQQTVKISVQIEIGDSNLFVMKPTDTIETLKDKIEVQLHVPKKNQQLLFNGQWLENKQTFQQTDIFDGAIVFLMVKPLWHELIQYMNKQSQKKIYKEEEEDEVEEYVDDESVSFCVRSQQGQEVQFKAKQDIHIQRVMDSFCTNQKLPLNSIHLVFNGKNLKPNRTVGYYNIEQGGTINTIKKLS